MAQRNDKWFLQQGVRVPGHPRREVSQEFFTNVVELGKFARQKYLDECKAGLRAYDDAEIKELDANIAVCEAELAKVK